MNITGQEREQFMKIGELILNAYNNFQEMNNNSTEQALKKLKNLDNSIKAIKLQAESLKMTLENGEKILA